MQILTTIHYRRPRGRRSDRIGRWGDGAEVEDCFGAGVPVEHDDRD